ncbi:MAG: AEC family transporter [Kiritimatiellae bacterium]|nr:AEC family transporter [Kiritimatiellia bacterium]MDW8458764.1 AEC family transporter [Verrucomicrobiota bacterium]
MGILVGIIAAGWWSRRRLIVGDESTRLLSRFCTDICFPALTFTQMLRIIGEWPATLQATLIGLGVFLLALSIGAAGWLTRGLPADARRTAWLSAAIPNWIFLPLPIAGLLHGPDGVATVLLVNVSAQILLWTVGVAILRGFRKTASSGVAAIANPGLVATVLGVAVAAGIPESRGWFDQPGPAGSALRLLAAFGGLTIPLSMWVTGAQLGAIAAPWRMDPPLRRVLWARLVLIPAITTAALATASAFHPLSTAVFQTSVLIAAMPTAISCGVLVERYGGDRDLAGRAIFASTLLGLASVPLLLGLTHALFR